ncbi:hypothetical protein D910_07752 [Dendroctonus ponderosae]|uniref:Alpha-mannosidase n=1 Tax=Dendroctonus ponderosae TaxID=77166 RepID=U4UDM8_DENPD|nr:hypothetical protein D910_07752 [Dendroctonus ponderosae]
MKLKRAVIICGFLLTLVVVFTIYSAKELTLSVRKTSITQDYKDNQWLHFEDRIKQLEDDLSRHHNAVAEIKVAMQNILSSSTNAARKSPVNYIPLETPQVSTMIYNSSCPISKFYRPKVDIQMLDLYNTLTFDNPDGGVWKQGWRIQIDEKEWNRQNKLKVFVVPHSHNDAGWTRTLLEYYSTQTKHILNNMLQKLPEDPRRKFIWAEISFFSMWWAELDNGNKEAVKRYDHITEWDVQYNNYQKLFDYMNKKLDLHVQAQFGTLSDYFAAVQKEKELTKFPVLSGDFFTYADRDDHYWSGYYTSRPFYKRMDRVLLSYIRAAETIEALTYHSGKRMSWDNKEATGLGHFLVSSRQELSLFQHHDGITGTAKDHVMVDYGKRMLLAIHDCQRIIQHCVNVLLEGPGSQQSLKDDVTHYNFDDVWHSHNTLPEKMQITIGVPDLPSKKIVIYNSLAFARHEVVTFNINTQFIENNKKHTPDFRETSFADVKIYNQYGDVTALRGFKVNVSERAEEFTFQNARIVASFNKLGLLKAVKIGSSIVPVHLDFAKYGVAARPVDRSGAYLFLPDGEASELKIENTVVNVVEGPVISSLTVQLPYVLHKATLYNSPGADGLSVELTNTVDIEETNNFELVMRMATNIDSKDEFFTDANGYQLVKRRRFKKLPLQANYYPMPTKAYIEDKDTRLTVLSSSPLGCSSLTGGEIEIMLDRRLNQDDNLGLGQAVLDNHPTKHIFRVLVEKRPPGCETSVSDHPSGFPTVSASVASESLLNPLFKLIKMKDDEENKVEFYAPNFQLGVDLLIPTFKTNVFMKGTYHTGLVLHRQFLDTCFLDEALIKDFPLSEGKVNLRGLFPHQQSTSLYQATLSFLKTEKILHVDDDISLCPMEMKAFYI